MDDQKTGKKMEKKYFFFIFLLPVFVFLRLNICKLNLQTSKTGGTNYGIDRKT